VYKLIIGDGSGESRDEYECPTNGRAAIEEKCREWVAGGDWTDADGTGPATVRVHWYLFHGEEQIDSGSVEFRVEG
jgi:hypothetical protein